MKLARNKKKAFYPFDSFMWKGSASLLDLSRTKKKCLKSNQISINNNLLLKGMEIKSPRLEGEFLPE